MGRVSGLHRDFTSEDFWSGTRRSADEATALHPIAYAGDEFFDVERDRLFGRAWVAVGAAAEVAEPGRMLVRTAGDTSLLITRGRDGVLRGFVNACRHRGTELAAADCSVGRMIRCPYHRWGYALDGSLVSTPLFGGRRPRRLAGAAARGRTGQLRLG